MRAGIREVALQAVAAVVAMALPGSAQEPGLALVFGSDLPASSVVGFYRDLAEAALDAPLLLDLKHRHGDAGLRCAVVVTQLLPGSESKALLELTVVADARAALAADSIGTGERGNLAFFRRDRLVAAVDPRRGLLAEAAALVAGKLDAAASERDDEEWLLLRRDLTDLPGERALEALQRCVARRPGCGLARGALFAVQQQKLADPAGSVATSAAAVVALANEPRALAAFASLALRSTGRDTEYAQTLVKSLAVAAAAHPDDLHVQLTRLRALVKAGEGRDVGRLAHQLARRVERVPMLALEYVEILTGDELPEVHRELAARALRSAEDRGADPRTLSAVQFLYWLRCEGSAPRAREIGVDALEREPGRVSINNEAWRWLTDLDTTGRFDAFALVLVLRMLEQKPALEFFECDTAAMALFRAGRVREAIELQQLAIARGGDGPIYRERLGCYQRALRPAAPR